MNDIILNDIDSALEIGITDVLKLNVACVYALYSDSTKMVHVSHTTNLLIALGRLLSDMDASVYGGLKYDVMNDQVKLKILTTQPEVVDDKRMIKLHASLYMDKFKQQGYTAYKPTNLVKYKIRKSIKVLQLKAFYVVDLVNSRNDKILVGVFRNKREMDQFLKQYYPNDNISGFYYANNQWTNQWRNLYTNDPVERER